MSAVPRVSNSPRTCLTIPMFEPSDRPRVFAVPLGVDFPAALVRGLSTRTNGQPPEALARTRLIVNTRRMARRIRSIYDEGSFCT